ncbi:TPA: GFA family protein [Stenotrophomonas maltophilia]|uniref:GFA family protein n=1 Tax=Stenotrophomonas maltophilia TaxID=40324 RepID=UPI0015DD35C9|nr:GFA family protein [Stenotrophomonas maltophilia]MBW8776756.1 GFA family protein [Stenotrophomonas sp.]QDL27415.1 GFA family protein [Stenotrophomonas maltophilia]HEL3783814.1 GFA family protein [Stenotrophomonas maltophilia]
MEYQGSCHCGRIAFTVQAEAPISDVIDCNCSMCRRRGSLLWFAPREAFQLGTDPADVATYHFNKAHIDHHHCRECGVAPYSEAVDPRTGTPMVAVNVRCVPQVDLAGLSVTSYNGAAL